MDAPLLRKNTLLMLLCFCVVVVFAHLLLSCGQGPKWVLEPELVQKAKRKRLQFGNADDGEFKSTGQLVPVLCTGSMYVH